jgi:hypothetical protein
VISGFLDCRTNVHHVRPRRKRLAEREGLQDDGKDEDGHAPAGLLQGMRVPELLNALVDREEAAGGEENQGHHERPEEPLAPVAEGVIGRGPFGRLPGSEHQESLIGGVGQGMERLGQERGGSGDQKAHELTGGDPQVRGKGGGDGFPAS